MLCSEWLSARATGLDEACRAGRELAARWRVGRRSGTQTLRNTRAAASGAMMPSTEGLGARGVPRRSLSDYALPFFGSSAAFVGR